jgi:hypothetical protein
MSPYLSHLTNHGKIWKVGKAEEKKVSAGWMSMPVSEMQCSMYTI